MHHARITAAALALCGLAGSARADTPPSRWDRARDPGVGRTYRLHVEVQRRLTPEHEELRRFSPLMESQHDRVRVMLERENAATSADVRLRFDLGTVYFELGATQGGRYYAKAAEVLKSALAMAPDHPAAEQGWLNLAFACGHLGDHECERSSYIQVLRIETEELRRLTPTLNLAETEMHLKNLKEAVDLYRETLRLASRVPARETPVLAVWGLAVALDRSGDRVGGEKEARFALELERSMSARRLLHSTNVFFVPAYEVSWYDGLGAMAQARVAASPNEAFRLWRAAEIAFAAYVSGAEAAAAKDPWLDLARLRLATAKTEREKAEKKRTREPPPLESDEETTL